MSITWTVGDIEVSWKPGADVPSWTWGNEETPRVRGPGEIRLWGGWLRRRRLRKRVRRAVDVHPGCDAGNNRDLRHVGRDGRLCRPRRNDGERA